MAKKNRGNAQRQAGAQKPTKKKRKRRERKEVAEVLVESEIKPGPKLTKFVLDKIQGTTKGKAVFKLMGVSNPKEVVDIVTNEGITMSTGISVRVPAIHADALRVVSENVVLNHEEIRFITSNLLYLFAARVLNPVLEGADANPSMNVFSLIEWLIQLKYGSSLMLAMANQQQQGQGQSPVPQQEQERALAKVLEGMPEAERAEFIRTLQGLGLMTPTSTGPAEQDVDAIIAQAMQDDGEADEDDDDDEEDEADEADDQEDDEYDDELEDGYEEYEYPDADELGA